jgi:hypothetical protein
LARRILNLDTGQVRRALMVCFSNSLLIMYPDKDGTTIRHDIFSMSRDAAVKRAHSKSARWKALVMAGRRPPAIMKRMTLERFTLIASARNKARTLFFPVQIDAEGKG